ncbi:MAG: flagellar basal body rod protein FlgC, partial [Gammaproteobacteria bacterium]|nr:flagellar basal body rod protein FlgC [Gammaproteobacteria bacterium]
ANADSASSDPNEVYRSRQPVFATFRQHMDNLQSGLGVRVLGIVESQAPARSQYQPDHPQADESGYVYFSNVNALEEMVNMMTASRSYQNNVEVINTSKDLLLRTLSLGQ